MSILKKIGLFSLALLLTCGVHAQHITTDPILIKALNRSNWEPGGKYYSFGSSRGAVDPASRTGSVTVVPINSLAVGNFVLENANISGNYGYVVRFSGHPASQHSPVNDTTTSSDSAKSQNQDGTKTAYSISWAGTLVHPADAYDGKQGGGYPAPTGARDEYNFSIKGIATGTYIAISSDNNKNERTISQSSFADYVSTTKSIQEGIAKEYSRGADEVMRARNFSEWATGTSRSLNSSVDYIFSGLNGYISGVTIPGISRGINGISSNVGIAGKKIADTSVIYAFGNLDIESQYETIQTLALGVGYKDALINSTSQYLAPIKASAITGIQETAAWLDEKPYIESAFNILTLGVGALDKNIGKEIGANLTDELIFAKVGVTTIDTTVATGSPITTRFLNGVTVIDQRTGTIFNGTVDLKPTFDRIAAGEIGLSRNDGSIFMNNEGFLPSKPPGYYVEYVIPTPGIKGSGPQRIVTGQSGEMYYTPNHYDTFIPVKKP